MSMARSTALRSSRMLPGQGWLESARTADGSMPVTLRMNSRL
jgi:hypothetical protein